MNLIKDGPKSFDDVRETLSSAGFNAAIANAKKLDKNKDFRVSTF